MQMDIKTSIQVVDEGMGIHESPLSVYQISYPMRFLFFKSSAI